MRLIFILQDLEFGGSQRQALRLGSGLDRERFSVEIWALRSGGGFVDAARDTGLPVRFLSQGSTVGATAIFNFWKALRRSKADVLVPFTAVPNIWARILGRLTGHPLVVGTCRGGGAIDRQHERLLWRLARHHVCNARSLQTSLVHGVGVPADRVTVIENGIRVEAGEPAPSGDKDILCVARLVEDKDHHTLVRAFGLTARDHPGARLTLVGDGPLRDSLGALIDSLGLSGSVTFLPGQTDLGPLYARCAILALSSVREASPNVILEAAAAGRPVVATRVGGIPQLVEDGQTGLLVPAESPEAMAKALSRLLADGELRIRMGRAGRERVRSRFDVERMVDRYAALFEALVRS